LCSSGELRFRSVAPAGVQMRLVLRHQRFAPAPAATVESLPGTKQGS
jgi:hypothetical protein